MGEEQQYKVEQVLDERNHGRWKKKQYLVKWKGYPDSDNQWLDAKDMDNAQELIAEFHNSHPKLSSHIKKALGRVSDHYPPSSLPQSPVSTYMSNASILAELPFGPEENTDPLPIPPRQATSDVPSNPIREVLIRPTFYRLRDEDFCNATARRSSTTCTIEVRGGQGREFELGTQLDDEKVDSVPHRST